MSDPMDWIHDQENEDATEAAYEVEEVQKKREANRKDGTGKPIK